jgi:hypothetical protein
MVDVTLMKGDEHPAVGELQAALNRLGARPRLAVDNDFGDHTWNAVLQFQQAQDKLTCGMCYGGVAGPETLDQLGILSNVKRLVLKLPLPHNRTENWAAPLGVRRVMYSEYGFSNTDGGQVAVPIKYEEPQAIRDPKESGPPRPGTAFVLSGYESLIGGRITAKNGVFLFHGPDDPDRTDVRTNECALLAQAFGLPQNKYWFRGPRVRDANPLPGTVVATLREYPYPNDYIGNSHTAIFLSKNAGGIYTLDQWNGRDIHKEYRKYNPEDVGYPDKSGNYGWVGDGDEYYVVYSTQPCVRHYYG